MDQSALLRAILDEPQDDVRRLADCPHLLGLRSLDLGSNSIGDAALASSPMRENLVALWLPRGRASVAGPFPRLHTLDLGDLYHHKGNIEFAGSPDLPMLRR